MLPARYGKDDPTARRTPKVLQETAAEGGKPPVLDTGSNHDSATAREALPPGGFVETPNWTNAFHSRDGSAHRVRKGIPFRRSLDSVTRHWPMARKGPFRRH